MLVVRALVLASLLCASCSASGGTADAGPPSLELGTGQRSFESLHDGDTIYIVQGPQGGFHFYGSLLARNIDPGNADDLSDPRNPSTSFEVFVGDTRVDAMAASYRQGLKNVDGASLMVGRLVILAIADDSELDGKMVRFSVRVEDANGVVLSDERSLRAIADPANP